MNKRPTDLNQRAKMIVDMATGEIEKPKAKDPAAIALGKKGGKARTEKMTPEQRKEAARKAAEKRWKKD